MHRFEDLKVWQNSMALVKEVYLVIEKMPKEEKFGLSDQIKRSAISIPSNIAEGAGRNNYGEFIQFLGIANGSCSELVTQLILVKELNLISNFNLDDLKEKTRTIQNMIFKLIQNLKDRKSTQNS